MTKICLTEDEVQAHKDVVDQFFNHRDYEVVQHWNDGYAAYWVVIKSSITLDKTLYCVRTFEVADRVQFSIDDSRKI